MLGAPSSDSEREVRKGTTGCWAHSSLNDRRSSLSSTDSHSQLSDRKDTAVQIRAAGPTRTESWQRPRTDGRSPRGPPGQNRARQNRARPSRSLLRHDASEHLPVLAVAHRRSNHQRRRPSQIQPSISGTSAPHGVEDQILHKCEARWLDAAGHMRWRVCGNQHPETHQLGVRARPPPKLVLAAEMPMLTARGTEAGCCLTQTTELAGCYQMLA